MAQRRDASPPRWRLQVHPSAPPSWTPRLTRRCVIFRLRQQAVESLSAANWDRVGRLWTELAARSAAGDEDVDLLQLVDSLARWSRNVSVEPAGRSALLPAAVPALKSLLAGRLTAFQALEDATIRPAVRSLAQLLANLAGSSESAAVLLPGLVGATPFDKNVVVRLLASEDGPTLEATVTFLFIALSEAPKRSDVFLAGPGLSIVELLLRRMERWFEAEGGSEERCFELGYELVKLLFEASHMSKLYDSLADGIAGQPISLPQSLLLKLFDAYLHSGASNGSLGSAVLGSAGLAFLLPTTERLLEALLRPMRVLRPAPAAEGDKPATPKKTPFEDAAFGKCAEGFSLGLKAVLQVALFGAEQVDEDEDDETQLDGARRKKAGQRLMGELLAGAFLDAVLGQSLPLIAIPACRATDHPSSRGSDAELLTLSDVYEPRLVRTTTPAPVSKASANGSASQPTASPATTTHAFAPVRKDVARLLGIVAASSAAAQASVADKGAIEVLLGMCALDVQNPCPSSLLLPSCPSRTTSNADCFVWAASLQSSASTPSLPSARSSSTARPTRLASVNSSLRRRLMTRGTSGPCRTGGATEEGRARGA